jgi:hypothetical protein
MFHIIARNAGIIGWTTIALLPVSSDFQFLPGGLFSFTTPKRIEKWVLHLSLAGDFVYMCIEVAQSCETASSSCPNQLALG